jgi:hypothetical protein
MKFNKVLNEAGNALPVLQNQDGSKVDVDDLSNPNLKSILQKIQNLKINYDKQLQSLQKQLENTKIQAQRKNTANADPNVS